MKQKRGKLLKKCDKLPKVKKKLWKLFSKYIRLRDCLRTTGTTERGRCVSCHKIYPYKELQAGHFIGGRNNSVLFHEKATHAQCRGCNIFKYGNQLPYRREIIRLYGEGYDEELERIAKQTKKYKVYELEEMIVKYKKKIKKFVS